MTISTTTCKTTITTDGATSTWAYGFYIPVGSGFQLSQVTAGVRTVINPATYTVSGIGTPAGGTFTYLPSGSPVAAGSTLTLLRMVPDQQLTSLGNQNANQWAANEAALDWIVMQVQQLQEQANRCLQIPPDDTITLNQLPPAAARASLPLSFDASGQPIV